LYDLPSGQKKEGKARATYYCMHERSFRQPLQECWRKSGFLA